MSTTEPDTENGTVWRAAVALEAPRGLFIGGRTRPARSGRFVTVEDPGSGESFTEVANGSVEDGLDALEAAHQSQVAWAATPPRRRSMVLLRAHELMTSEAERLATTLTLEMGKPFVQSLAEVRYAADYLRWYAEEAVRVNGRYAIPENGLGRILTMAQPVGPCLFVTPWNFPLAMGARKVAPALAAGCTCVIKPATLTPLSMLNLAEILREAGLPSGVVNVVTTTESSATVAALMKDSRLRKISFTGSTEIGRVLVRQSADQLLRVSMELGGNAPFIVFDDADLEAAVEGALQAKLRNNGEACTAANRILVQRGISQDFVAALSSRFESLRVGHGLDETTDVGPLIDRNQLSAVTGLIHDAIQGGAVVATGGTSPERPGHFMVPTVLTDVPPGSRILREEIFGPVAPVVTFDSMDEVIAMANASDYGLASYVYTNDVQRAIMTAERLEAGMVAVNQGMVSNVAAPFGGVKHSGFGREGGPEGMAEYLETKYLALNAGVPPSPVA